MVRQGPFAVILAHAAVGLNNNIFPGGDTPPVPVIASLLILLSAEAVYTL